MRFIWSIRARRGVLFLFSFLVFFSLSFEVADAATIGTVVPVVGVVTDMLYDSARNVVYLANVTRNEVDIYSVGDKKPIGNVPTGLGPESLAISPDLNTLYVANVGSNTISAINLNTRQRGTDYTVGSRPDAIAMGYDGLVVILGSAGLQRLNPSTGGISAVPITPPPTPAPGLPTVNPIPTAANFLAGLITTASGNLIVGLSQNRLFVYEVASGTVLRSRNVSGMRSIMSASSDGSRFMAGPFLFDTQTLTILGRSGTQPVRNTLNGVSIENANAAHRRGRRRGRRLNVATNDLGRQDVIDDDRKIPDDKRMPRPGLRHFTAQRSGERHHYGPEIPEGISDHG